MNISNHFELLSILSGVLWLLICLIGMAWYRSGKEGAEWKLFYPAFLAKIVGGLAFSGVYIFYYAGGDTLAYWDGAVILNKLFWNDFGGFISEMFTPSSLQNINNNFTIETGYPPGWIYREPESFFVSKVYALLSLITLKSYWAMTFISATLMSLAFWNLYLLLLRSNIPFHKNFGYYFLFIPTPLFWCMGVSKDTIVLLAVIGFTVQAVKMIYHAQTNWKTILLSLLYLYLIFKIRPFIYAGFGAGIFIALTARFNKERVPSQIQRVSIKTLFYLLSIGLIVVMIQSFSSNLNELYNEVLVIQNDFATNQTYGDKRYIINANITSPIGLIQALPLSVIAALYRPFLWEALSPLLILNGAEGLILLFFTLQLFYTKFKQYRLYVRSNELLLFSLIFVIVLGFSIGFTSGLFGVLVRLKSLILPFVVILIMISPEAQLANEKPKESS